MFGPGQVYDGLDRQWIQGQVSFRVFECPVNQTCPLEMPGKTLAVLGSVRLHFGKCYELLVLAYRAVRVIVLVRKNIECLTIGSAVLVRALGKLPHSWPDFLCGQCILGIPVNLVTQCPGKS